MSDPIPNVATCPCGWTQTYTSTGSANRGIRRHRCSAAKSNRASLTKLTPTVYDHGLRGGTWVLDQRRRVLVWKQQ